MSNSSYSSCRTRCCQPEDKAVMPKKRSSFLPHQIPALSQAKTPTRDGLQRAPPSVHEPILSWTDRQLMRLILKV